MAEVPLTETLNPSRNGHDSLNSPESSELPSQSAAEVERTTTEKRKREDEAEPNQAPVQKQHPLWKTSLCSYFRRTGGSCSHGDTCRFAHGESELLIRPDNTWDPTSERVKKVARKNEDSSSESVKEEENGGGSFMMTEVFAEGEEGGSSVTEAGLTKCLVNLPMRWTSDNLRSFLSEHVSFFFFFFCFPLSPECLLGKTLIQLLVYRIGTLNLSHANACTVVGSVVEAIL